MKILAYADDIAIVFEEDDLFVVLQLLKDLEDIGLKINFEKSGVLTRLRKEIPKLRHFPRVKEYRYLGVSVAYSFTKMIAKISK